MDICSCCFKEYQEDDPCGSVELIHADELLTGKGPDAITVLSDGDKMFTGDGHWSPVYGDLDSPVNKGRANKYSLSRSDIWHFKKDCECKH